MSETTEKSFIIRKVYTKNVSFEAPNSPQIFTLEFDPKMDVTLNVESFKIEESLYHALIRLTVTVKVEDKTAFLCEVEQAGIFVLTGFDDNELSYMLGSHCPNALFPFAREAVSDLVVRGGFPQLLVDPVNFDALYADHMQQRQVQQSESEAN
ncbi:protein-export chaperone SecB [Thiomicrospira pelophila]|uniref:protein-export chaperone SecB n=1 Tax=Thiomicrospira pelophila TaxID=934 RepID=UPI0004A74A0B|nr:protein-export chaperone SecB [Thiomicrospira pelophila]